MRFMMYCRLLATSLFIALNVPAYAQEYPQQLVRIIVPFPPTGTSDILARLIARKLSDRWKVAVIIENRPGAAGNIGMDVAAKAPKDGYTLVMANSVVAINVSLYPKIFDIEKDFKPLGLIGSTPMVLAVNPSVPAKNLAELTALAKKEPGKLSYGSCGLGTPQQLAVELYRSMVGVSLFHVPYRGCAPAVTDVLAGQIQILATTTAQMGPQIASGLMRGLAVTSKRRSALTPDIPTFEEAGLAGYELDIWFGLMAPAGAPRPILEKIHRDVSEILLTPQSQKQLEASGVDFYLTTREEHAKILRTDIEKYAALTRDLKLGEADQPAQR